MLILSFFLIHWFGSLFFQSFFLHRYGAHGMFKLNKTWERIFYVCTYIFQGSSFLNPGAYAVMHRLHHSFSDTKQDPHSPIFFKTAFGMMMRTKDYYIALIEDKMKFGEKYIKNTPSWEVFDRFSNKWGHRILWGIAYTLFYYFFAEHWWMFLLLPVHFLMGPIHGAIVNWAGHKYGYQNFKDTDDHSRNTLFVDFLALGELFQNNHHKYPNRPNFAVRFFEFDPVYPVILLFNKMKILSLNHSLKQSL